MKRDIPSLREWLGDGARGEGFEEWVAEIAKQEQSSDPGIAASHRIIKTMVIAMVEAGRIERAAGCEDVDTCLRIGRAAGFAVAASIFSRADDDVPVEEFANVIKQLVVEGIDLFLQGHAVSSGVGR